MTGVILGRELHRRVRRFLPDLFGDVLIDGRPELDDAALGREGSAEPHRRAHRVAVFAVVRQVAEDRQVFPERFERPEDLRELEVRALLCGCPLAHDRAVRHVDEAKPRERRRRRLCQRLRRGNHAVEERQRDGHAETSQDCATGDGLLRHDHDSDLLVWNGALFTMPSTSDENLYPERCASLTIARTNGMSQYSMPCPMPYDSSISVVFLTNSSGFRRIARRRAAGPSIGVPSANCEAASIIAPLSVVRQRPIPSKFSRANPMGSMSLWHPEQAGLLRCSSMRSRMDLAFP